MSLSCLFPYTAALLMTAPPLTSLVRMMGSGRSRRRHGTFLQRRPLSILFECALLAPKATFSDWIVKKKNYTPSSSRETLPNPRSMAQALADWQKIACRNAGMGREGVEGVVSEVSRGHQPEVVSSGAGGVEASVSVALELLELLEPGPNQMQTRLRLLLTFLYLFFPSDCTTWPDLISQLEKCSRWKGQWGVQSYAMWLRSGAPAVKALQHCRPPPVITRHWPFWKGWVS